MTTCEFFCILFRPAPLIPSFEVDFATQEPLTDHFGVGSHGRSPVPEQYIPSTGPPGGAEGRYRRQAACQDGEGHGQEGQPGAPGRSQARYREVAQAGDRTEGVRGQDEREHALVGCDQEGRGDRKAGAQRERQNEGSLLRDLDNDAMTDCPPAPKGPSTPSQVRPRRERLRWAGRRLIKSSPQPKKRNAMSAQNP